MGGWNKHFAKLFKFLFFISGSKNRPAWPIAPGIANANQPRQITLISGEDELEWEKNRLNVAEAAGLKHVDITVGDQADIYGQGYNGKQKCQQF